MTLAQRLAAFAASLAFEDVPDDVVASVRLRTLDVLGIALASSRGDWAPAVIDLAYRLSILVLLRHGPSPVFDRVDPCFRLSARL